MRRSARGRRGKYEGGGMLEVTDGDEFGQRSLQTCGGSATNSVDLAMFCEEKEKGGRGRSSWGI
jgi:hypothetical protein